MVKKTIPEPVEESESESSEGTTIEEIAKPKRKTSRVEKPKVKREQTEAQKQAFVKARESLMAKNALKKAAKEEEQKVKEQLKAKVIAKKEKKHVTRTKKLQELSESESSEEEVIVKKRSSKKKIIYVDDDDHSVEKHKPIINIYNNGKEEKVVDVIPIRKARGVFL